MSKHGLKYNVNQRKFSLKFIIYLFVLLDLMLYFNIPFNIFGQLLMWEIFTFMGLLIGMRGQVRYRELVWDLIAIRNDPQYNDKEELRGFKLARHIDHACIEWDLWYQEQQIKISKKNKKTPGKLIDLPNKLPGEKKTKNLGVKKSMSKLIIDEVVWKQIGYSLVSVWELFMPVIALILEGLNFHWIIILFLVGAWGIFGALVMFYIHYVFNLEQPVVIETHSPELVPELISDLTADIDAEKERLTKELEALGG